MAVDEAARHQLYTRLTETLGEQPTSTLMSLLPPVGWADVATKADLRSLENAIRAELHVEISGVRGEFAELRGEFGELRAEFGDLQGQFGRLRGEFGRLQGEFAGLQGEFAGLQGEFGRLKGEFAGLRGEFGALGHELRGEMAELRGDVRSDIASLEGRMSTASRQQLFALLGAMFTIAGLASAGVAAIV